MNKYLIIFIFFVSCKTANKNSTKRTSDCNENIKFKTEFFKKIKIVEDYIETLSTTNFKDFEEYEKVMTIEKKNIYESSVKFISQYSHVSFESMANYARTYPIGVFKKDKEVWLKWYEENKCNNIQFK